MRNFRKFILIGTLSGVLSVVVGVGIYMYELANSYGAPPYVAEVEETFSLNSFDDTYETWTRPNGPIKIGLQAGHWKTKEMPEELARIRDNGGGTSSPNGIPEWEVVLAIAEETKIMLEMKGYVVDILPATVPENYWADAFISIHADGSLNPTVNGYKVAASARDRTYLADDLERAVDKSYSNITKLKFDPNITRNMTRYYAFNYRRYKHSIHPMTPAILVETGFLTNPFEANFLINQPEIAAKGISDGVIAFIETYVSPKID